MGRNIISELPVVIHLSCGPAWMGKDRRQYSFYHITSEYLTHEQLRDFYTQLREYLLTDEMEE